MRNQTSFRLTTTLLPTDSTAKTTDVINKVDSCGCKFKPNFTEETVVLTNDDRTVMETTRAYSCNGTLCFVKRGLSDDVAETEIANRKLTRNPGTLAFVTAGASDYIDKDDDVTWTGNQTYTGTLTSTCCATYCGDATYKGQLTTEKGVKYPNFASVACLQAYDSPYGGMFATVDDTGELYRYNANTCCWDMVSTVALGTYTFQVQDTAPDSCTADTIITIAPPLKEIYVGTTKAVERKFYADLLIVGGGGGGGSGSKDYNSCGCSFHSAGGGGGMVLECYRIPLSGTTTYTIGAGGAGGGNCDGGTFHGGCGCSGCNTIFGGLVAYGGGGGGCDRTQGLSSFAGGGGGNCSGGGAHLGNPCFGKGGGSGRSDYFGGWCGGSGGSAAPQRSDAGGIKTYFTGAELNLGGGGNTGSYGAGGVNNAGKANTGGGGGGVNYNCCDYMGGGNKLGKSGGSGVIYVRYPKDGSYGYTCATGGTKSEISVGGVCFYLHTLSSGSGCFNVVC